MMSSHPGARSKRAIAWSDTLTNEIIPMSFLQMGTYFYSWTDKELEWKEGNKVSLEELLHYLKKFHARSKIIFIFNKNSVSIYDKVEVKDALSPFLGQKLFVIEQNDLMTGRELLRKCVISTENKE